ncbi:S8 family serine peptidase [Candidatus Saccharibacteria bacterium]|nr:S8 family serine peptidase [Candidatus Saccharibacteria bacterium]
MKKQRLFSFSGVLLLAFYAVLNVAVVFLPASKAHADTPNGPTKRVVVRYSNVLGANTNGDYTSTLSGYVQEVEKFDTIPYGVYNVDAEGESSINGSGLFTEVFEDRFLEPQANVPLPSIGADAITGRFSDTGTVTEYDGTGYAVAILDTGVDKSHSLLTGKVISEACFGVNDAPNNVSSLCTGGVEFVSGNNTAIDCSGAIDGCGHGTGVAGAAAMPVTASGYDIDSDMTDDLIGGVAEGADIVALKIFSQISDSIACGGPPTCARVYFSSVLSAIDYLNALDVGEPIVAANMSLGGAASSSESYNTSGECSAAFGSSTYNAFVSAFAALKANKIAPVVANGNNGDLAGNEDGILFPACVQGSVAVGATNVIGDTISSFSNNGALTTLLAPGGDWDGVNDDSLVWLPLAETPNSITGVQGTSEAAPMVSGAFAVLREKHPNASVDQLVTLLQNTGTNIAEVRAGYSSFNKKIIDLTNALTTSTYPTIDTFTGPGGMVNEGSDTALTIATTNAQSCSLNNGIGSIATSGVVTVPGFASYTLTCTGQYNDTDSSVLNIGSFNPRPTQPNLGQPLTLSTDVGSRSATISWQASTDPDGIDHYEVFLDGASHATTTGLSYTFTDLGLNYNYTAAVYAVDTLGAWSLAASTGIVLGATSTPGTPDTGLFNIFGASTTALFLSATGIVSTGATIVLGRRYYL